MRAYLYPTYACENWVGNVGIKWKESGKPYFALTYLERTPKQLINKQKKGDPFWLYMYYAEKTTKNYCPEKLPQSNQVKYRIRVIDFELGQDYPFRNDNVYKIEPPQSKITIWFKCDGFEEIQKLNTKESETFYTTLSRDDFEHEERKNLPSALRSTIPPVRCIAPIAVI